MFVVISAGNIQLLTGQITKISGIVNKYVSVISKDAQDKVTVSSVSGFSAGDTVMFVQMKGGTLDMTNIKVTSLNDAGRYQFLIIDSVITSSNQIIFQSYLFYYDLYDVNEKIQLIRVPSYSNAEVNAPLTCSAWNGSTGGILTLITDSALILNDSIYVNAKGYRGADSTIYSGTCPSALGNYYIKTSYTGWAGLKGEGIVADTVSFTRGRGPFGNAGGGGDGKFSGGGGGGSYGSGGRGGIMFGCFATTDAGGYGANLKTDFFGGSNLENNINRIIMGGGGGAGTGDVAGSCTGGGNGGGLVFIIARNLVTNGNKISAAGESVTGTTSYSAGAGGGGGGGEVLISADTITGLLYSDVRGGNGGNTAICSGQGGGGGGGVVWLTDSFNISYNLNCNYGMYGTTDLSNCTNYALMGSSGDTVFNLEPVLNGFLFNKISSSQTICYGEIPLKFTGSQPKGGNGVYTYQWQKRKYKTTTWSNISGATSNSYQSTALTDSTEFRRVVKSYQTQLADSVTDVGKIIRVNVIPQILNNSIAPDTAICYGLPTITIRGTTPSGGDGTLTYYWEIYSGASWEPAVSNTSKNYSATNSTATQYYRRKVISNICSSYSNTDTLTIYPAITGNTIESKQTICYNYQPSALSGSAVVSGGNNSYSYLWQKSTDSATWVSTGVTTTGYSPGKLTAKTFYRRIIKSGLYNTCKDTSNNLTINITPSILNNTITGTQTICQNKTAYITGSSPSGGEGSYICQWEKSPDNLSWDSVTIDLLNYNYTTSSLWDTVYYRRIVLSGKYNCCKDTSASVLITVQPLISGNNITASQEICYNQIPGKLIQNADSVVKGGNGTSYTYSWAQRPSSGNWSNISSVSTNYYQPPALTDTMYYYRTVVSGACTGFSDTLKIDVLSSISGNSLSGTGTVCRGLETKTISGGTLSGGTSSYIYQWQDSIAGATWNNVSGATGSSYSPGVLTNSKYFRRIVSSGSNNCCISKSSPFYVLINELPVGVLTTGSSKVCKGSELNLSVSLTGNSPFNLVLYNTTDSFALNSLSTGSSLVSITPLTTDTIKIKRITDINGCLATSKSGKAYVAAITVPIANAGVNDSICGLSYTLQAVPSVGNGTWSNLSGNATFSDKTACNSKISFNTYGVYPVRWKEVNDICSDSADISLSFFEQPEKPQLISDTILFYQFECTLGTSAPLVGSGLWSTLTNGVTIESANDSIIKITGLQFGQNIILYSLYNGNCAVVTDTLIIEVDQIKRYSGFSPNGDGINDFFVVDGLENATVKKLLIINRWGNTVFSDDNYNNNWNGTGNNGSILPDDTYFYVLTIDNNKVYKGYIVLKR